MSDDDLAVRRRRLKFRSGHRGLRELDILLGGFVADQVETLDAADIADVEALLDVPDQTVFGWFIAGMPDPEHDTPVWRRITAFHKA